MVCIRKWPTTKSEVVFILVLVTGFFRFQSRVRFGVCSRLR